MSDMFNQLKKALLESLLRQEEIESRTQEGYDKLLKSVGFANDKDYKNTMRELQEKYPNQMAACGGVVSLMRDKTKELFNVMQLALDVGQAMPESIKDFMYKDVKMNSLTLDMMADEQYKKLNPEVKTETKEENKDEIH